MSKMCLLCSCWTKTTDHTVANKQTTNLICLFFLSPTLLALGLKWAKEFQGLRDDSSEDAL